VGAPSARPAGRQCGCVVHTVSRQYSLALASVKIYLSITFTRRRDTPGPRAAGKAYGFKPAPSAEKRDAPPKGGGPRAVGVRAVYAAARVDPEPCVDPAAAAGAHSPPAAARARARMPPRAPRAPGAGGAAQPETTTLYSARRGGRDSPSTQTTCVHAHVHVHVVRLLKLYMNRSLGEYMLPHSSQHTNERERHGGRT
jgi:hypothetical protein